MELPISGVCIFIFIISERREQTEGAEESAAAGERRGAQVPHRLGLSDAGSPQGRSGRAVQRLGRHSQKVNPTIKAS